MEKGSRGEGGLRPPRRSMLVRLAHLAHFLICACRRGGLGFQCPLSGPGHVARQEGGSSLIWHGGAALSSAARVDRHGYVMTVSRRAMVTNAPFPSAGSNRPPLDEKEGSVCPKVR